MSTNIIKIRTKNDYNDYLSFISDPEVEIIEENKEKSGIVYKFNTDDLIYVPNRFLEQKIEKRDSSDMDLIFGKDKTENVVSIEVDNDLLYVYTEKDGIISCETRNNEFWLVSPKKQPQFTKLAGKGYYKYIRKFDDREDFLSHRKHGFKMGCWSIYNSEEANMVHTGITMFKGMKVKDVSVLSFDIEGSGLVHNDKSKVFCISNTFRNKNNIIKKFFSLDDYNNDSEMIEAWCEWVREIDPSVICGHNVFGYDLGYLAHCNMGSLPLGRDGSDAIFDERASMKRKDGSQSYEFHNVRIHGRHVIDTMFLSYDYDFKRDFPSYGLKPIIKHLKLEKEDRQHYDASKIAENWDIPEEREKIKAYAKDDADDALALYELMIPSFFYWTQSIPKTFQQIINGATGSQLNALLVRSYLQNGECLPKTSKVDHFQGATSMGIPGMYHEVRKVDVASLYPSIIRQHRIYNKFKDPKANFLKMVDFFTLERLNNKRLANETGDKYYQDLEQAQKIGINSAYGLLGATGLLFNSPKDAEMVTAKGREILIDGVIWATGYNLKHVVKKIKNKGKPNEKVEMHWVLGDKVGPGRGYQLVNVDTDSFSYTNGTRPTKNEFAEEIKELNSIYPELINWEDDDVYQKVLVSATKNYVLQKAPEWCKEKDYDKNGNIELKYKGSSLTDQKKEPILIDMLKDLINILMSNGSNEELLECYHNYCNEALNITDINKWLQKKTVTESVITESTTASAKIKASYIEAIQKGIIKGVQEGDKVWIYQYIKGKKQKKAKGELVFLKDGTPSMEDETALRFGELFDGNYDKWHLIKRCYSTVDILKNLINMDTIPKYYNKTMQPKLLELLDERQRL